MFIPIFVFRSAKVVLQGLSQWIHDYINTQDELGMVNSDVRVHKVFYSVCQALFYIVVFRHKDFVHRRKGELIFIKLLICMYYANVFQE